MNKNNWFVITGGPAAGKTTTINLLSKKGYKTFQEAARIYYESQMAIGKTNEEIKANPQLLQDSIAEMVLKIEGELSPSELVFLDRGIPDNYAYYEYFNVKPPQFIVDAYNSSTYKKIFYLERVSFERDAVRIESDEQIKRLENLAMKYYKNRNMDIIVVPVMQEEKRVEFILQHI